MAVNFSLQFGGTSMILSAIAEKLKRRSKDDLSGRGAGYRASVVRYAFTVREFHSLLFAGFAGALIT